VEEVVHRVQEILASSGMDEQQSRLADLEQQTSESSLWDDPAHAQQTLSALTEVKDNLALLHQMQEKGEEAQLIVELLQEMEGLDRGLLQEAAQTVSWLTNAIDGYELAKLLSGPYDKKSARLTISAGAGGTDAQVGLFTTSMIVPVSLSTTPELS